MKTKKLDVKLVLSAFLLLVISSFVHKELHAATAKTIKCSSLYGKKIITMTDKKVSMKLWEDNNRSISSVSKVRTQKRGSSITKTMYLEGKKHEIHVKNINKPSDVDDYMTISNQEGHQMTYALNCYMI